MTRGQEAYGLFALCFMCGVLATRMINQIEDFADKVEEDHMMDRIYCLASNLSEIEEEEDHAEQK